MTSHHFQPPEARLPPTKHHFLTHNLASHTPCITDSTSDCPICLDAISPAPLSDLSLPLFTHSSGTIDDYRPSTQITTCAHVFHYECLSTWLDEHSTCPACREVLFVESGGVGVMIEFEFEGREAYEEEQGVGTDEDGGVVSGWREGQRRKARAEERRRRWTWWFRR